MFSCQEEIFKFCSIDDVENVAKLLESNPELLNTQMKTSKNTPLMHSVLHGSKNVVKYLLDHGADPTIGEAEGYTPMHGAGYQGRADIVPLLVAHGINPNDIHRDGFAPIHRAAWGMEPRHTDTVYRFLLAGVDPLFLTNDGKTALMLTRNEDTKKLLTKWEKKMKKKTHSEM